MPVIDVPVPCTFDFNVAATKYFHGLSDGDVPLSFLFSGTAFYESGLERTLLVAPVPWDKEATFRLPVRTWHALMDHYYPNGAWLRLRLDTFERLGGVQAAIRHSDLGRGARAPAARGRAGGAIVNADPVDLIARTVLYEGYLLYPYRPSAVKNRQRFTFGVLYPPRYCLRSRAAAISVRCRRSVPVAGKRRHTLSRSPCDFCNSSSSTARARSNRGTQPSSAKRGSTPVRSGDLPRGGARVVFGFPAIDPAQTAGPAAQTSPTPGDRRDLG